MKVHLIGECNSFQNPVRNFSEANGVLVPQAFKKIRYFSFWTRSSLPLLLLHWFSPGSSTASYLTFQRTWLGICGSVTTCQDNSQLFQDTHRIIEDSTYSRAGTFQWSKREPAKRDEPHSPETSGDGSLFTTGQVTSAKGQYSLFPGVHPISLDPQLPPLLLLQDTVPINWYFGARMNYSTYRRVQS